MRKVLSEFRLFAASYITPFLVFACRALYLLKIGKAVLTVLTRYSTA